MSRVILWLLVGLAPLACREAPPEAPVEQAQAKVTAGPPKQVLEDVTVLNWGKPIYRGRIDLRPTIQRILRGEKHPHRNDGATFHNRERRLPQKRRGYYREYVHPTPGLRDAGPQRIVRGRGGDWWYTPDHYKRFIALQ